jgi:hypothetical protein
MNYSTNPYRRFNIPSANVDLDTLAIAVQKISTDTATESYFLADDITELTGNSKVYFVEEDLDGTYVFYFGDNVIGKKPEDGSVISATYLITDGSVANNISSFTIIEPVGGEFSDSVTVTTLDSSYGARDKETINQIKFRAPYYYTAQNRAITKLDYQTLITKDYPNIDSVAVWGGEENLPIVYGKVYLSLKTTGNYVLTNAEKESIKNALIRNRNVVTVTPEIIDPLYIYMLFSGKVYYNPSLTTKTAEELKTYAKAGVSDYISDKLNTFDSTFRKSKLQSYIESSESSITGSDIDVYVQRRITLEPSTTKTYEIDFDIPLTKGDYYNSLYTFPQVQVYDSANILRSVFFEEVPNAFTGVDSIRIINGGSNYTSAPTVTISGDGTGATATATIVNGRVISIEVTNRGINYTRAIISITGGEGSGATATARLEARFGKLRSYYYNTSSQKIVVNSEAGDIDYDSGRITLNSLFVQSVVSNEFYDTNVLTINALPRDEIIRPLRNRILVSDETIDTTIQIDMVAEQ